MHNEQKVTKSVYWIGSNDFITPRFDNYIPLKRGISYNSYFIDDEKTCILDAVDNAARDLFLGNVKELLHDRPLDYIIVNHMEPDLPVLCWNWQSGIRKQRFARRRQR